MRHWDDELHVNIGAGEDLSIRELAEGVRDIVHPKAKLVFDASKPDGHRRATLLDISRLHALGWRHSIGLARDGVRLDLRVVPGEPAEPEATLRTAPCRRRFATLRSGRPPAAVFCLERHPLPVMATLSNPIVRRPTP